MFDIWARLQKSAKDDCLVPIEQHAPLGVPLHGARQHLAFGVAAYGGERFHGLIRAALIAPNTIPKAIEQIAAKRKLLMPDEIMIFIVV